MSWVAGEGGGSEFDFIRGFPSLQEKGYAIVALKGEHHPSLGTRYRGGTGTIDVDQRKFWENDIHRRLARNPVRKKKAIIYPG